MRALGEPLSAEELSAVYAEAMACRGIHWRHQGRVGLPYGHQNGLDCVGFLIRIVRASGRPVGDIDVYARTSDGAALLAEMDRQLGPRVIVQAGSIVMLMLGKESPHVGIVSEREGRLMLTHCYAGHGVVEHGLDDAWRRRIVAAWAL